MHCFGCYSYCRSRCNHKLQTKIVTPLHLCFANAPFAHGRFGDFIYVRDTTPGDTRDDSFTHLGPGVGGLGGVVTTAKLMKSSHGITHMTHAPFVCQ